MQRGVPLEVRNVTLGSAVGDDPVGQPLQPGAVRIGFVVHVRKCVRRIAVARIMFEGCVGQVGCVVPEALFGSAVGAQAEIPRRFAVHVGELLDVLPGVRQCIACTGECDGRREHQ